MERRGAAVGAPNGVRRAVQRQTWTHAIYSGGICVSLTHSSLSAPGLVRGQPLMLGR